MDSAPHDLKGLVQKTMIWIKHLRRAADKSIQPYSRVIVTAICVAQPALLLLAYLGMNLILLAFIGGMNFTAWLHYAPSLPPKTQPSQFLYPSIPLQLYSSIVHLAGLFILVTIPRP